jgi:hypothetical protein
MGWLWHRRLAHVGMKNLHKLLKGEHIWGLTHVHFEKDRVCSACQAGKQVGVHHPHKNIMTTVTPGFKKANRMRTMYVPGSVIHVHSSYIIWTSSHSAQNSINKGNS